MIISWFRSRRRRKLLLARFLPAWARWLQRNVAHYGRLGDRQQQKLRDLIQVFVAEKHWEGCGGLVVNDEMRVTVAAGASLLVLGVDPNYYFDRVKSILIYPHAYLHPPKNSHGLLIQEEETPVHGEAWHRGPIVISWQEALRGMQHGMDGRNVVLHEFAHHLDGLNGRVDGVPPLGTVTEEARWQEIIEEEYHNLLTNSQRGRSTLMDHYGATDKAEFFAVATECFFECSLKMRRHHPVLFHALSNFYRLDPTGWRPHPIAPA